MNPDPWVLAYINHWSNNLLHLEKEEKTRGLPWVADGLAHDLNDP